MMEGFNEEVAQDENHKVPGSEVRGRPGRIQTTPAWTSSREGREREPLRLSPARLPRFIESRSLNDPPTFSTSQLLIDYQQQLDKVPRLPSLTLLNLTTYRLVGISVV